MCHYSILTMSNAYFNVSSNHPLIPREQTYLLDRKLVTIHSVDRDINKWPNSNHFEITLPEPVTNVQSMQLVECSMPANFYIFSNAYQNTKLHFTLKPMDPADPYYTVLASNWNNPYEITITEGFYTPDQLANELEGQLNKVISTYLADNGITSGYSKFKVAYHDIEKKFWFANEKDQFYFDFTSANSYELNTCQQQEFYKQPSNWGLGFNLGFEKSSNNNTLEPYESQPYVDKNGDAIPIQFYYLGSDTSINTLITPVSTTQPVYYLTTPNVQSILGDNVIYMEVNKYNQYDELVPYSTGTNQLYTNDYRCKVNSAFAKIPLITAPFGMVWDSRNGFLQGLSHFDVPIERIAKLEFKFRYHDGRLVDFQQFPFNFTIAFYQLKNEIARQYDVRIPFTYQL